MCCAYGTAFSLRNSLNGGARRAGNGSSEFKNVLSLNFSMRCCFSFGILAGIGANGIFFGHGGGGVRSFCVASES